MLVNFTFKSCNPSNWGIPITLAKLVVRSSAVLSIADSFYAGQCSSPCQDCTWISNLIPVWFFLHIISIQNETIKFQTRTPFSRRCTTRVTQRSQNIYNQVEKIDSVAFSLTLSDLILTFRWHWPFKHVWLEYKHKTEGEVKYDKKYIWPWPLPNDIDTQTWPRYGQGVSVTRKWSS